jgi:hypothetical protein
MLEDWKRSILMGIKATGLNWKEVNVAARNKVWWQCWWMPYVLNGNYGKH